MLELIRTNLALLEALGLSVGFLLAAVIVDVALREYRRPNYRPLLAALAALGPRHLVDETAVHTGEVEYEARHAAPYEVVDSGPAGLDVTFDGGAALVRAYVLLDEPSFAGVAT